MLFVWTAVGGLFLVNLGSGLLRNVDIDRDIYGVVPYVSYYIPGITKLTFQIVDIWNG